MANADTSENIISFLANNVEEELDIFLIKAPENQIWNKSLSGLPIFTIKEIERHRKKSFGKVNRPMPVFSLLAL